MAEITREQFLRDYSKEIDNGSAALFIGAGLSVRSGFVDWRGLLKEIANDLGLNVDEESDLIALAQYEFNSSRNRYRLNTAIIDEFKTRAAFSEAHRKLARLPIEVIWTTNYDKLIEHSLEAIDKLVDVKCEVKQLPVHLRNTDVTVYKMHGDVDNPDSAVLTKDDYERFDIDRRAFTEMLRTDLTRFCFLFVGFSFTDPNIEYIFGRLRTMLQGANRTHYCIMRRPQKPKSNANAARQKHKRDLKRFGHRIEDLKRFGIRTFVIENHADLEPILQELVNRSIAKNVFVSGSADEYRPMGREQIESLARTLGRELILRGYRLVTGYGLGIGGACILGAYEAAHTMKMKTPGKILMLRMFPRNIKDPKERIETYKKIRSEMMEQSCAVVFLAGNKIDSETGKTIAASGMLKEFAVAKQYQRVLIPVPSTGHVAKKIWDEIEPKLDILFPRGTRTPFRVLTDSKSTEKQIIEAVFTILEKRSSKRKGV